MTDQTRAVLYAATLKAIAERAEIATLGPWEHRQWDDDERSQHHNVAAVHLDRGMPPRGGLPYSNTANDSEFIAHARTDIPLLLSHIEAREQLIDSLKSMLERIALNAHEPDKWGLEFNREFAPKTASEMIAARAKYVDSQSRLIDSLTEALGECEIQFDYLEEKGFGTSTSNAVRAKIEAALRLAREGKANGK